MIYSFFLKAVEEDPEAPAQVQYRWIARDVVAIQPEQPYDLEDEPTEAEKHQGTSVNKDLCWTSLSTLYRNITTVYQLNFHHSCIDLIS